MSLVLGHKDRERLAQERAGTGVQQGEGGSVGLLNDALQVGDEISIGSKLEEVEVTLVLVLEGLLGLVESLVLHAHLLVGNAEFFNRGVEFLKCSVVECWCWVGRHLGRGEWPFRFLRDRGSSGFSLSI